MSDKGLVLELQRMSTEDGPGIRTTVFMKGCTLKCFWCHNPESISPKMEVQWVGSRCIGCRTCVEACPEKALTLTEEGMAIDRQACTGCGICAEECPSTAMESLRQWWTVKALADEVEKDRSYFEESGGGITVSGGEPTLQADFVSAFLAECRGRGLHTALDTCGQTGRVALEKCLAQADHVLFDLKEMDPARHKQFTGHDNKRIRESCLFVRDYIQGHDNPSGLWIRTPVIPGATDNEETVKSIGRFIAKNLSGVVNRWELCAFNNLCRDKYLRLGLNWSLAKAELLDAASMDRLHAAACSSGVDPNIVFWSGSTRMEDSGEPESKLKLVKGAN